MASTGSSNDGWERQRVRLVSTARSTRPDQQVSYTVTLEWGGTETVGSATGEQGDAVELRTAATAALAAVAGLVPAPIGLRLAGVKQLRAFDAELVVVSIHRLDAQPGNLVGAVVVAGPGPDNGARAAVAAVLNALNRLLDSHLAR
jgi:hypothetical protein